MSVQLKMDYVRPISRPLELVTESFICNSVTPPMGTGLDPLQEEPYTWTL